MNNHEQSKHFGMNAENFFASILNKCGIQFEFVDQWYDFLINNNFKVEVKSCQLSVKDGPRKKKHFRPGRFDFTNKESRELQFEENVWVAFILRNESEFLLLGFARARELEKKRYIPLINLRKIGILSFDHWFVQVNKKQSPRTN